MSNEVVEIDGMKVRPEGVSAGGRVVTLHHIVGDDGKTSYERNMELVHEIPLLTLVETSRGLRLWVQSWTRDCDGTPLYNLTMNWKTVGLKHSVHNPDFRDWIRAISTGHNAHNLTVIRPASDLITRLMADGYLDEDGRPQSCWATPEQEAMRFLP